MRSTGAGCLPNTSYFSTWTIPKSPNCCIHRNHPIRSSVERNTMFLDATSTPACYAFTAGRSAGLPADSEFLSFLYPHHSSAVAASLIATAEAFVSPVASWASMPRMRPSKVLRPDSWLLGASQESPRFILTYRVASVGGVGGNVFTSCFRLVCTSPFSLTMFNMGYLDYISGVILYYATLVDFPLVPVLTTLFRGYKPLTGPGNASADGGFQFFAIHPLPLLKS